MGVRIAKSFQVENSNKELFKDSLKRPKILLNCEKLKSMIGRRTLMMKVTLIKRRTNLKLKGAILKLSRPLEQLCSHNL